MLNGRFHEHYFCRFMVQSEQEQDDLNLCQIPFDDLSSGQMGMSLPVYNSFVLVNLSFQSFFPFCLTKIISVAAVSSGVITSTCMDNGSIQVLHSATRLPVIALTESHQTSSVPNGLPSLARVGSIGKQFGHYEPNLSLDEMKFGNQHPSFHPHSLPEYHDSLANGLPYNSPSTIADIASSVGTKIKDGLDSRHIRGVSSNGHLMEPTGGGKFC